MNVLLLTSVSTSVSIQKFLMSAPVEMATHLVAMGMIVKVSKHNSNASTLKMWSLNPFAVNKG